MAYSLFDVLKQPPPLSRQETSLSSLLIFLLSVWQIERPCISSRVGRWELSNVRNKRSELCETYPFILHGIYFVQFYMQCIKQHIQYILCSVHCAVCNVT
jgi:hypothetical protein